MTERKASDDELVNHRFAAGTTGAKDSARGSRGIALGLALRFAILRVQRETLAYRISLYG